MPPVVFSVTSRARQAVASPLAGLLLTLALFGAPLFLHLDRLDLHNDEANYSYLVERILETHDWLTPRGAPNDYVFVEKPPLKFWIVAAGITWGLLPVDEVGMRAVDAAMGAAAFGFVFLLGYRLRGPVAGLVSVLTLFTFEPLLFEHGLRSNNMEAALLLSYCAGFYHFMRWLQGAGRGHAYATATAFVLGFMTKFVAVAFLPFVAVVVAVSATETRRQLATRWRDWLLPGLLALAAIVPWFAYQTVKRGTLFWDVIVAQQVYQRLTTGVDPSHLERGAFYVAQLWEHFANARALPVVLGGLCFLIALSVHKRDWRAWLVLLWAVLPIAVISLSSSKLIHYVYPFLPPLALGAGWMVAEIVSAVHGRVFRTAPAPSASSTSFSWRATLRQLASCAGYTCAGVAIAVLVWGPIDLVLGGTHILRSHSVARPAILALALFLFSNRPKAHLLFAASLIPLAFLLPLKIYPARVDATRIVNHPFNALSQCLAAEIRAGRLAPVGTYLPFGYPPTHTSFYYLRKLGPYRHDQNFADDEVLAHLTVPERFAPMILPRKAYDAWMDRHPTLGLEGFRDQVQSVLLPGPYAVCRAPALAAGAARIEHFYHGGRRPQ